MLIANKTLLSFIISCNNIGEVLMLAHTHTHTHTLTHAHTHTHTNSLNTHTHTHTHTLTHTHTHTHTHSLTHTHTHTHTHSHTHTLLPLQMGGSLLLEGMEENSTLQEFDLRLTEISQESEYRINELVKSNQDAIKTTPHY